jgi:serine protease Do
MRKNSLLTNLAIGAAAMGLAGAGGYMARAGVGPQGAVNAAPLPTAGIGAPVSFADIIQHVAPAVVSIEVEGKVGPQPIAGPGGGFSFQSPGGDDAEGALPPEIRRFFQQIPQQPVQPIRGAGSGFFISSDGYVVTNNHVVAGAEKITVHTADDRTFKARVIGRDPATDVAVLKIEASGLPFVSFEDRAKPRVGDWVVAVGNPYNLGGTATAGIVSALGRRNVSGSSYVDYMQIDAPINRGNSCGPTFDLSGRVVGVNTAIFSPSGGSIGIGFDIPADVVAKVSRELISTGKVTRGYIGASVQDVTPEIADSLGIAKGGALVAELTPGGPAAAAGLQTGDLIVKVDGQPVADGSDLTRQVSRFHAGDAIRLEVRRDGQMRQITVKSGLRPSEDTLASNDRSFQGPGADGADGAAAVLGLRVAPDPQGRGVRVAGVANGSDAALKGLRPGDIIMRVGERAAHSPSDLSRAVAQARQSGRKQVLVLVARGGQHSFVPLDVAAG